jgi:hypothetical protein
MSHQHLTLAKNCPDKKIVSFSNPPLPHSTGSQVQERLMLLLLLCCWHLPAAVENDPAVLPKQLGHNLLGIVQGHLDERVPALLPAVARRAAAAAIAVAEM